MDTDSEPEDRPREILGPPERTAPLIARVSQLMGEGQEGVWTGTKFQPPSDSSNAELSPEQVFALRYTDASTGPQERFCIRRRFVPTVSDLKTMCIFTDGACLDNGSSDTKPRAGAAFVFKSPNVGTVSFALENKGVDGQVYAHTNNRAELRAVIAALRFRGWFGEGWHRLVIVTDAEYVAKHATGWLRNWAARDWRVASGQPVANQDLWKELSAAMGSYAKRGCEVSFWLVPRRMNAVADRAAKAVAEQGGGEDKYSNPLGIAC